MTPKLPAAERVRILRNRYDALKRRNATSQELGQCEVALQMAMEDLLREEMVQ